MPREYQEWRSDGLCYGLPLDQIDDIFFLNKGKSANKAREFCSNCIVRPECLDYAITYTVSGIWAGTTEKERKQLVSYGILTPSQKVEEHDNSKFVGPKSEC